MEVFYQTLHFSVMVVEFMLLGCIFHVARALINPFPDKIGDKPLLNIIVSSGYSWHDHIFGTEYDDAGYYRLDSFQNWKVSIVTCAILGIVYVLIYPELGGLIIEMNEWLLEKFKAQVVWAVSGGNQ